MKKLLQSPFLHFICIGAGIFLLYGWLNQDANHPEGFDIHISEDHQVQMALAHQRNFGELPDPATMDKLIAAEVKSEIYYREALRLGLDENDEIIRRRLKQKYEFLIKDNAVIENPTEEELKGFYNQHKDRYLEPGKYSFDHYYFSPDRRTDPAKDALSFINTPSLSADPFHISSPKMNKTINDLRNEFGLSFAQGISEIDDIEKHYVVESGFGHHVIHMRSIEPSAPIAYSFLKDRLTEDYRTFILSERNKEGYEELKKEYSIDVESIN